MPDYILTNLASFALVAYVISHLVCVALGWVKPEPEVQLSDEEQERKDYLDRQI